MYAPGKRHYSALLIASLVIFMTFAVLFYQPFGVRVALRIVNHYTPITLQAQSISGSLGTGVVFNQFTLDLPRYQLHGKSLTLELSPWELLLGRLHAKRLDGDVVTLERRNTLPKLPLEANKGPDFPLFWIDEATIHTFRYRSRESVWYVDEATIFGARDQNAWAIQQFTLDTPYGKAQGQGRFDWNHSWSLGLHVTNLNPLYYLADEQTALTGQLALESTQHHYRLSAMIKEGLWMGQEASGHYHTVYRHDAFAERDINLHVGNNHLTVLTNWSEEPTVSWEVAIPSLTALHPHASGTLYGDGHLSEADWSGELQVKNLQFNDFHIDTLSANVEGESDDHDIEVNWRNTDGEWALSGEGFLEDGIWTLRIEDSVWSNLQLQSPTVFSLSPDDWLLKPYCVQGENQHFCLSGQHTRQEGTHLTIESENVCLSSFDILLPARWHLRGKLSGEAHFFEPPLGRRTLDASANLTDGQFDWVDRYGDAYTLPLEQVDMNIDITPEKGITTLKAQLSEGNRLEGSMELSSLQSVAFTRMPMRGEVIAHLANIDDYPFLFPNLRPIQGEVTASLPIRGTLSHPLIQDTHVQAKNWILPLTDLGIDLHIQEASLTPKTPTEFALLGTGTLGNGPIDVRGLFAPFQDSPSAELRIEGTDVTLIDTKGYHLEANGGLLYHWSPNRIAIDSDLTITSGWIRPQSIGGLNQPSDDVIVLSPFDLDTTHQRGQGPQLYTSIALRTESPVHFEGWGLAADVVGSVRLNHAPNAITTATGLLSVESGMYRAFSNDFTIESGEFLFNGGPYNTPAINLEAEKILHHAFADRQESLLVGLKLQGNLQNPALSFYSNPVLSDADILSYLLIGRPQSEASENQSDVLLQGALQLMNLIRPQSANQDIQRQLGLDELQLKTRQDATDQTSGLEETTVIIGKQLNHRLYVRYTHGISQLMEDSTRLFNIQYKLGRHTRLDGTASNAGYGGDILWDFDLP